MVYKVTQASLTLRTERYRKNPSVSHSRYFNVCQALWYVEEPDERQSVSTVEQRDRPVLLLFNIRKVSCVHPCSYFVPHSVLVMVTFFFFFLLPFLSLMNFLLRLFDHDLFGPSLIIDLTFYYGRDSSFQQVRKDDKISGTRLVTTSRSCLGV